MQFPRDKFKLSSKKLPMLRSLAVIFSFISITPAFAITPVDTSSQLIVSVRDQKLMLVPGRDPITTRIIWLRGLEAQNAHAFQRCIYIHGTPQEKAIGRPASYGCIRMKSSDVAALYDRVPLGTLVQITPEHLPKLAKAPRLQPTNTFAAVSAKPQSQDQTISPPTSDATLSVEQMRMRGALAAQRQKAKLELDKRL